MELLREFANNDVFMLFSLASTLFVLCGAIYAAYLILAGVLPVLLKLGKGLSNRKICVFAESEYRSLETLLVDSNLFKKENIIPIHKNDMDKAGDETVFLVHWKDFENEIDDILRIKKDSTALIVYSAPGAISHPNMEKIANKRNTVVVNFRGRLLNDILTSLITTAYEKK
jgi:hypothetical protein